MDSQNLFSFFAEDKKTYLSVMVPGSVTGQPHKVRWNRNTVPRLLTALERSEIISHYQDQGLLTGYSTNEIENMRQGQNGWIVAYPPNVSKPRLEDACIFEQAAYQALEERLWTPLSSCVSLTHSDAECVVQTLPKIVTLPFIEAWYHANQKEAAYLNRLHQKAKETRITHREDGHSITLKMAGHPFVNQPTERILLFPDMYSVTSKRLTPVDQNLLRLKLFQRDAYRLKGLSDAERTHLSRAMSANHNYQIHWVKWLSLNGDMSLKNAILVTRDTQMKYRILIQKPFDTYWEQNMTELTQSGKKIFAEIPIPMTEYRLTPIRPVRTKRQNRYYLNRLTKITADNYQHEN